MPDIAITLLSEGTSDRALLPILSWMIRQHSGNVAVQSAWADPGQFPHPPKNLTERIRLAASTFTCDLLFVHRDADRMGREARVIEISDAAQTISPALDLPIIAVVPVRMMEAWLLHDEEALRLAAGRPKGGSPLELPRLHQIESIANPKQLLNDLLRNASGATGRRLKQFNLADRTNRLANLIDDFSPLQRLPAFQAMEADVRKALDAVAQRLAMLGD